MNSEKAVPVQEEKGGSTPETGGMPVYCGVCRQRLFDLMPETKGGIEIKCPRCRRVVRIRLGTKMK